MGLATVGLAALLLGMGAGRARAAQQTLDVGDLNGDGQVTVADVELALRVAIGMDPATPEVLAAADVSPVPGVGSRAGRPWGDGKVTMADVIILLRHIAGLAAGPFPDPNDDTTLSSIQRDIFTPSCAVSSCHSNNTRRANLDLSPGYAYASLVNVAPSTVGASANMRVVPGHPEESFLMTKLTRPGPNDGVIMPFGTPGLDQDTVARIREWISKGAPLDAGDVLGPPKGAPPANTADVTLPVPPPGQGFQVSIGPFDVPPGQEIFPNYGFEIPSDTPVDVYRVEYATNPGTHHMYLQMDDGDTPPPAAGVLNFTSGTMTFVQNRYVNQVLPKGVVFRMKAHQHMTASMHYVNASTQLTLNGHGKVVINFWTEPVDPSHVLAQFFETSNPNIVIPPHSTVSFTLPYTGFPAGSHVFALWGHFHSRGKKFVIQKLSANEMTQAMATSNGQMFMTQGPNGPTPEDVVYRSATWDDPLYQNYDPPLAMGPGDGFWSTATYENDGDQTYVEGGFVETNEHFFTMGLYYVDPTSTDSVP